MFESKHRLSEFDPQQLAMTVYSLSRLVRGPDLDLELFLQVWVRFALRHVPQMRPVELSNSIYALGVLRISPELLQTSEFYPLFLQTVALKISHFTTQGLANCMYGLGLVQSVTSAPLQGRQEWGRYAHVDFCGFFFFSLSLRKWAEAVVRSKHVLKPQEISNSLLGMKQLDLKPAVVGAGVYLTLTKQLHSQIAHFTGQGKNSLMFFFLIFCCLICFIFCYLNY
jgi:hypothetical protein